MKTKIFNIFAIIVLSVLFYSNERARIVTSDGLQKSADLIRP